jgi:hypothetical protein
MLRCLGLALGLFALAGTATAAVSVASISVHITAPVADAYIEDIAPIVLASKSYPDLVILWAVGDGTRSLPVQILSYEAGQKAYIDNTKNIVVAPIPKILNPRNFVVTPLNGSGYDSIAIANQGLDQSPWPGTADTLLLSRSDGRLFDASARLPRALAYTHDVSSGRIARNGTVGIFFNNIYSEPGTAPTLVVTAGDGRFVDVPTRLPPSLGGVYPAYTSSALVDVNGDGVADLILGAEDLTVGPSWVYLNPGNGDFRNVSPTTLPPSPLPPSKGLYSNTLSGPTILDIRPIHISSPKFDDLIVVSTNGDYTAYAIQILTNDGHGHFTDETKKRLLGAPSYKIGKGAAVSYWLKRAWVFTVDGLPQIVTESGGDLSVPSQVFLNDGKGHFILSRSVLGTSFANAMYVAGQPALIESNYSTVTLAPFP